MTTTIQLSARDATLDTKLSSTPIPRLLRRTIIETIFNYTLREDGFDFIRGLDAYFSDWYEEQCEVAAGYVSVTTHRELLDVITQLQSTTLTRSDVLRKLLQDSPSIDHGLLNGSINLAARLWLTVSLGSVQQSLGRRGSCRIGYMELCGPGLGSMRRSSYLRRLPLPIWRG